MLLLGACVSTNSATGSSDEEPTVDASVIEADRPVFNGSPEEWALRMVDCFREAGYPAEVDGTGVWVPGVSGDARLELDKVGEECRDEVGSLPEPPLTPEFLTEHYYEQLATKECLEKEGYVIADPPTVEVFVETYTTSDPWLPYTSIVFLDTSDAEWDRLNEVCPQPG